MDEVPIRCLWKGQYKDISFKTKKLESHSISLFLREVKRKSSGVREVQKVREKKIKVPPVVKMWPTEARVTLLEALMRRSFAF